MIQWFDSFLTREGTANGDVIILEIVVALLIGILSFLVFVFRRSMKVFWNWIMRLLTLRLPNELKKFKVNIKYKKTIKQIERKKIPIPEYFLRGKSPENNSELRKIFQMIEDGLIEAPDSYKISKMIQGLKLDDIKIPEVRLPNIELFDPNKYLKK